MLIRFTVSNFLSFKDETEFNMLTAIDQRWHQDHVYHHESIDLLKTAAIYGANGAGKSNFMKAVSELQDLIVEKSEKALLGIKKFKLDKEYEYKPTKFEIEFIKKKQAYIYGLSFNEEIILEEWLYKSGLGKKEDEILFDRTSSDEKNTIQLAEKYNKSDEDRFRIKFLQDEYLKKDSLLLNELYELKEGFEEIKDVHHWFSDDLIIIFPRSKPEAIITQLRDSKEFKNFADHLICSFHTGIEKMDVSKYPIEDFFSNFDKRNLERENELKNNLKKGKTLSIKAFNKLGPSEEVIAVLENDEPVVQRITSKHRNRKNELIEFHISEESDGTNRLLDLIPAVFDALTSESTVMVDEIDQSIHPSLLKELINKFVSNKKTKGQLIFSTHESNLLDQSIFRRDEIWFVEKDHGETKMYALSDYDIRADLDIRKGYLNGRFGAIPFLGNLKDLNWTQYAE